MWFSDGQVTNCFLSGCLFCLPRRSVITEPKVTKINNAKKRIDKQEKINVSLFVQRCQILILL